MNKNWSYLEEIEIAVATSKINVSDDMRWIANKNVDVAIDRELNAICQSAVKSDFRCALDSDYFKNLIESAVCNADENSFTEILEAVSSLFSRMISECETSRIFQYILLFTGISALQEFVRCNWTGPNQDKPVSYPILAKIFSSVTNYRNHVAKSLSDCGVSLYHNVKYPELLFISKFLFTFIDDSSAITKNWWMFRCLMIHQLVLLEKSSTLFDDMKHIIQQGLCSERLNSDYSVQLQLDTECGIMYLHYGDIAQAKHFFNKPQELAGLHVELSGAFAKRTQFQQKAVAQLLIKLKHNRALLVSDFLRTDLPKDIALEDEVLLSKTKFLDDADNIIHGLLPEEQLMLLSECCLAQKSDASDELLKEKLMAYIDCLLGQPSVWCIQVKSLLMRSKLEKDKSRKIDRAMKQIESILSEMRSDTPDLKIRQYLFFSVLFQPYWVIEKELADILISLGAVKSALEVYLRLELWEEIVNCYKILGQNEKAAEIVRKNLEQGETPYLWCILGDVTGNIECYHKSWELSNHRNARSQSSLGYFHYKKQEYENSIPYFEKSLSINHLQLGVWFSLAFAATQTQNYDLAAQAYRNVVGMDPENFQAWNNLSNAYIKLNQKSRAYRTLQEALKCNYDNWKIWENYILVCMDIGAFEDAINAYHRLMDLKGKYEDVEVMTILTKAICNGIEDFHEHPASRLKQKALELFGRVTSIIPNNKDIWKQYSLLYLMDSTASENKETMERVVTFQQKGHKFAVQKPNWEKDPTSCKNIISNAIDLGKNYCIYLHLLDGTMKSQIKSSAKLLLRNVVVRVEKNLLDMHASDVEELEQSLCDLKLIVENIEAV